MDSWVHCTDFVTACKAVGSPLSRVMIVIWFVLFVSFIWLNKINQINQMNQINRSLLGLGLAGGLRLFSLEFGPAVIEPFRGCAGCVKRFGSFL